MKEEFGAPSIMLVFQEFDSVGDLIAKRKAELFVNLDKALECNSFYQKSHEHNLDMINLYEKKL